MRINFFSHNFGVRTTTTTKSQKNWLLLYFAHQPTIYRTYLVLTYEPTIHTFSCLQRCATTYMYITRFLWDCCTFITAVVEFKSKWYESYCIVNPLLNVCVWHIKNVPRAGISQNTSTANFYVPYLVLELTST